MNRRLKNGLWGLILVFSVCKPLLAEETVIVIPHTDHLRGKGLLVSDVETAISSKLSSTYKIITPKDLAATVGESSESEAAIQSLTKAKKFFNEGRQLYDNLKMGEAMRKFIQARSTYYENLTQLDDPSMFLLTLFYLGLISNATNDNRSTLEYFQEILAIDENYRPDPALAPPAILQKLTEARKYYSQSQTAYVSIYSEPAGAVIRINGKKVGVTPLDSVKILLRGPTGSGDNAISLSKKDYVTYRGWVNFNNLSEPKFSVSLQTFNQRDYAKEFASLFDTPNNRSQTIQLAQELQTQRQVNSVYLWTIHLLGDRDLLVIGKIDAGSGRAVAANVSEAVPGDVEIAVNSIFELLDQPGGQQFASVKNTIIPKEAGLDFDSSFLGYFNASSPIVFHNGSESAYVEDGESTPWYNNKWVWIGGGAGLLIIGGVVTYLIVSSGGDNDGGELPPQNKFVITGQIDL